MQSGVFVLSIPHIHIYIYRVHKPLPRFLWFGTSYVLPVSHAQPLTHLAAMTRVCKWSERLAAQSCFSNDRTYVGSQEAVFLLWSSLHSPENKIKCLAG